MQIRLIRHGKTPQGERRQYQGSLDTSLSENGRKSLRKADDRPEKVFVTPLKRTQETAEILFPGTKQIVVAGLAEMCFGDFEGRSWKDMENDAAYRIWVDGNCEGRCPGGEDRASFSERVCHAFKILVDQALKNGEPQLVIVAHGGTQMAVLERWGDGKRAYYEWQTACGNGWLLQTEHWPDHLQVMREIGYTT